MKEIYKLLENNPVIPGLKGDEDIAIVEKNDAQIVFILYGDVAKIEDIVDRLKNAGKTVFVNMDLISGFSSKNEVMDFMKKRTRVDGVISTKASMLRYAKSIGLITVHRFFLIDSFSYESVQKQLEISGADIVNVVPGWPKVVGWICDETTKPVIAAGLVCDRQSVIENLRVGAAAICTTSHSVWDM